MTAFTALQLLQELYRILFFLQHIITSLSAFWNFDYPYFLHLNQRWDRHILFPLNCRYHRWRLQLNFCRRCRFCHLQWLQPRRFSSACPKDLLLNSVTRNCKKIAKIKLCTFSFICHNNFSKPDMLRGVCKTKRTTMNYILLFLSTYYIGSEKMVIY